MIARKPIDDEINQVKTVIGSQKHVAKRTPLRSANSPDPMPILHTSVSCKWTIRSDRAHNTKTETLNLIRHRKGKTPHIVAVVAESLPTRIAYIALGTGDIDCVYHFALAELDRALQHCDFEAQMDMLATLIQAVGRPSWPARRARYPSYIALLHAIQIKSKKSRDQSLR